VRAVKATGRKKLIMAALWTEVCLVHPALDAIADGFEVYPVVDCVAGTSLEAHEAGLRRLEQAGGKSITWVQLICELQRDWSRRATVPGFSEILFAIEGH
jgi:nicotinamidase-related amidase